MYSERVPISIHYLALIVAGVLGNIGVLLWFILTWPEYTFESLLFVPLGFGFLYSLYASSQSGEKEIISPIYILTFNSLGVVLLAAVVYRDLPLNLWEQRMLQMVGWCAVSIAVSQYLHRAVRFLIGAYGQADLIENSIISYEIQKRPEDVLHEIKKKWLILSCGMEIAEKKTDKGKIKIRLNKARTNLYLLIYGTSIEPGKCLLNIIPYAMTESLRRKNIATSEEIKEFLMPQIRLLEQKLELVEIGLTGCEPQKCLVPETVEYALYPARFPVELIREHKKESRMIMLTASLIMASIWARVTNAISDTIFSVIIGVLMTSAVAVIGYWLRR